MPVEIPTELPAPDDRTSADVVVYDVGTLDVAYTIQAAHDGSMRQIVPTSDGEGFVTVGQDGFIRVWRTADGLLLHEIPTGGLIAGVELSDDERHVIVQMADGRVIAWTFDVDELLAIAASRLTRGFTAAECRAYQLDPCPTLEEMRSD